jgi:hypothetical protein
MMILSRSAQVSPRAALSAACFPAKKREMQRKPGAVHERVFCLRAGAPMRFFLSHRPRFSLAQEPRYHAV